MLTELHVLLFIGQVRVQPSDGGFAKTEVGLEPLQQHVVGNCLIEADGNAKFR